MTQYTSTDAYGLLIGALSGGASDNEELYHGKELTDAHGLNGYHYGARFYEQERNLITEGRFDGAMQVYLDVIKFTFGSEYDDTILQMIDS